MKIFIVSWFFPPANVIGAVRVSGFAEYLHEFGDDVRVVTARGLPHDQTLSTVFPEGRVNYTPWADLTRWLTTLAGMFRCRSRAGGTDAGSVRREVGATPQKPSVLSTLKRSVTDILTFPDKFNGWIPYGIRASNTLLKDWRPDLIFASGPHFSALLIAHVVARRHRIPLVCELRDRWWDDPYHPPTPVQTFLARRCEARILGNAKAITTVSEPWAEVYRERYRKPVAVIYNGYDHADNAPEVSSPFDDGKLNILYTGHIYPGRRDPSPLFAAVANDSALAGSVCLWFYGTDPRHLEPLVRQYHLDEIVMINPSVPHSVAIALQRKSDILLLMQWTDPREQGNIPAKLFEYLGSLRPILLLGLEGGVPDVILRERNAGILCNSPEAIGVQLRSWLATKRSMGSVPSVPYSARSGFSRREQFEKLRIFLKDLCAGEKSTLNAKPTTFAKDTRRH